MRQRDEPKNRMLQALTRADHAKLSADLTPVTLSFKEHVYEPGKRVKHVYFMTSGMISIVTTLEDDDSVETGTIGREGLVGLPVFLGQMIPSESAFCQVPGSALRMEAKRFLAHVEQIETLRTMLLRYSYATIVMTSQIAACNRAHKVEARLARWLLMTQDRADGPEFPLTQDLLSQMLGVHRPAVSVAGATLQNAGLIKYTRGKITVVDRKGLEDASCNCYGRIRAELAQVFRGDGE